MARVEIEIDGELLDSLSAAFFWEEWKEAAGPAKRASAQRYTEFLVAKVDGLRIRIQADEHPPPHFHVTYQGEDASFSITDCARLPGVKGLERFEPRIRKWWEKNRELLVEKWNSSRPSDCPVGPISGS